MLKLLALDMLFGSTKNNTTNDLIHQIIEASNHIELSSIISKKATLKTNRKYAKQRLKSITKAGTGSTSFIWLIVLGVILIFFIIFAKTRNKRRLTVDEK